MICSSMTGVLKATWAGYVKSEVSRCGEGWNIFSRLITVWGRIFCKGGCYIYIAIPGMNPNR